jgi:N-methylhydantoinase A/oxoprolinase/acetone carboxylase beta subunit
LKLNIAAKVLADDGHPEDLQRGDIFTFLGRLLRRQDEGRLCLLPRLSLPLVADGAPASSFFPAVAEALGARLVIPDHAEVANAVGAVTGKVVERAEVRIRPQTPEGFAVVSAEAQRQFATLEAAIAFAEAHVRELAQSRAEESGGAGVEVVVETEEETAPLAAGWGDSVLLELKIAATAIGTPAAE